MGHNFQMLKSLNQLKSNILITGHPGVGYTTAALKVAEVLNAKTQNIELYGLRPTTDYTGSWVINLDVLDYRLQDSEDTVFYGFGQNLSSIFNLPWKYIFYLYADLSTTLISRSSEYREKCEIHERADSWISDALRSAMYNNMKACIYDKINRYDKKLVPVSSKFDFISQILLVLQKGRQVYDGKNKAINSGFDMMRQESTELAESCAEDDYNHAALEYIDVVGCLKLVDNPSLFIQEGWAQHVAKCQKKGYDYSWQQGFIDWLYEKGFENISKWRNSK